MSVMPARTASSTTYWMAGLSTRGNISFGWALVAGRNRVPRPAAGMTALRTREETTKCFYPLRADSAAGRRDDPPSGTLSSRRARLLRVRRSETSMPTYEYRCKSCGEHLEVVQSFKDDPLTECPACGGPLRKVFGNIGIAFKGSGFYRNDSRSGSKRSSSGSSSGSDSGGASSSGSDSGAGSGGSGGSSDSGSSSGSSSGDSGSSGGKGSSSGSGSSSGDS